MCVYGPVAGSSQCWRISEHASIYLAFPGFGRAAPHKALVNDAQVLLPVLHFKAVHVGAAGRTHGRVITSEMRRRFSDGNRAPPSKTDPS